MKAPVIQNWCVGFPPFAINYKFPMFMTGACVRGTLSKSEKEGSDIVVVVPKIVYLDTQCRILKTRDKIYSLGEPEEDWLKWLKKMKMTISEFDFNCL